MAKINLFKKYLEEIVNIRYFRVLYILTLVKWNFEVKNTPYRTYYLDVFYFLFLILISVILFLIFNRSIVDIQYYISYRYTT